MDLKLKNKTALVLGASQGLGEGIARELAAEGCHLILAARNIQALETIAAELRAEHGINAEVQAVDMTNLESVDNLCQHIKDRGDIDILLNNAGGPPPSLSTGVDSAVWQASVQALLFSVIQVTEACLEPMKIKGWGRVLTIASSGVVQPIPNLAVTNTIRSAIVGFSKTLSEEVAQFGITVNIIIPGKIDTSRVGQLDQARANRENKDLDDVRSALAAAIPTRRYGRVEEFAAAAVFLLSERASYTTGHMMRVDGGSIKGI
ncbi:MAG: SDR family oxidoreductase [Kordiimonadaceae bacterium]|nr:SDR family oxidoreductase [Kordiimonadaceae bacterium]